MKHPGDGPSRCPWPGSDPLYLAYHDLEWGMPLHDDQRLFEMLVLEGAQAGLSWLTILRKRARYREAFAGFDPRTVSRFTPARVDRLLQDEGLVRNRQKIESAVANARHVLNVIEEFGRFDAYIWQFVGGRPIVNAWTTMTDVPPRSPEAEAMSRDLRARGFGFVGPTICYAFMQATGMVNDHLVSCFRHEACRKKDVRTRPRKNLRKN
jgi:DNA-3-methyladenine glycosylase I